MPLTMTRSIQLELAIDSGQRSRSAALASSPRRLWRDSEPLHIASRGGLRRVDSVRPHRRPRSQPCADCGGPLVVGEGVRTCVICGKSSRRAS